MFVACNANSQESKFSIGINGGVNFSNVDMESLDTNTKVGYQFGVVVEYDLQKNFFLRSGMNITSKGFKWDVNIEDDINGDGYFGDYARAKTSWNAVYLKLPVMLGHNINVASDFKINFAVGGYLAYGVGGKIISKLNGAIVTPSGSFDPFSSKDKDNTFSNDFLTRFDSGLVGGIGAEYQSFIFNLGYEYGLNDISQGAISIYNRNAFFTVGYRFF